MVILRIEGDNLVAEVQGFDKLWACASKLEIPLRHIKTVTPHPADAHNWWHGWKMIGTDIPGIFAAGLFRTGNKWVFWDVRHPEKTIEIELVDEHYNRVIVEVDNPDESANMIRSAILG